jgi:two-component system, OmpR family, sensor histidine kinase MprB
VSLRGRIALLAAGAVALAVAVSTLVAYFATGSILRGEIDERLAVRASMVEQPAAGVMFTAALPPTIPIVFDRLVEVDSILQVIDPSGQVMVSMIGVVPLPVEAVDLSVAQGGVRALRTVKLADERFRMVTAPMVGGGAVQIAMSLTEAEGTLTGLRLVLLGVGLIGVLVAAWIGWLIANRALRPIGDLTDAAETIASTHELSTRIPEPGRDEIGRLAGSFNRMLDALEDSRSRQQQLVTDASHEFRTPLTSLLTNVETLSRHDDSFAPDDRAQVLEDIAFELRGLSSLAEELVDLATDPKGGAHDVEAFRLEEITAEVVGRERRRTGRQIDLDLLSNGDPEPGGQSGYPDLVERAIRNLIDNAHKWSPSDTPLLVTVSGRRLTVVDHGPGISQSDKLLVFERFYRSTEAKATPGSGLGLSIVKHMAEVHGGRVFVEDAPGGGAVVGFELP